jgi:hypothetical protein
MEAGSVIDLSGLGMVATLGLALGLVVLGAGATALIGWLLPEPVLEASQRHGRFAGLAGVVDDSQSGGSGRRRQRRRVLRLRRPEWLAGLAGLQPQLVPVRA